MMLLPSALPCDVRRPSLPRFAHYAARERSASPAPGQAGGIRSTCRALHSLLGVQPQPQAAPALPTRPAPPRPKKPSPRVVKRPPVPPRGGNKRRRSVYEEDVYEVDSSCGTSEEDQENVKPLQPATPKRQCRRAPTHIPFGLERRDFYDLPITPPAAADMRDPLCRRAEVEEEDAMDEDDTPRATSTPPRRAGTPQVGSLTPRPLRRGALQIMTPGGDGEFDVPVAPGAKGREEAEEAGFDWGVEDDRMLVGLVLDKLRLSRRQWDECARQLGADQRSLGARWKFLLDEGKVGLKLRRGGTKPRRDVREMWT